MKTKYCYNNVKSQTHIKNKAKNNNKYNLLIE